MIDSHLNFQEELKNILMKMACGIKTIAAIHKTVRHSGSPTSSTVTSFQPSILFFSTSVSIRN